MESVDQEYLANEMYLTLKYSERNGKKIFIENFFQGQSFYASGHDLTFDEKYLPLKMKHYILN